MSFKLKKWQFLYQSLFRDPATPCLKKQLHLAAMGGYVNCIKKGVVNKILVIKMIGSDQLFPFNMNISKVGKISSIMGDSIQ